MNVFNLTCAIIMCNHHVQNPWNLLRLVTYALLIIVSFVEPCYIPGLDRMTCLPPHTSFAIASKLALRIHIKVFACMSGGKFPDFSLCMKLE